MRTGFRLSNLTVAGAVALLMSGAPGRAHAESFKFVGVPKGLSFSIFTSGGYSGGTFDGISQIELGGKTFYAFCIDPFHIVNSGYTATDIRRSLYNDYRTTASYFTATAGTSTEKAKRVLAISYLANKYLPVQGTLTNLQAANIQAALWNFVADNDASSAGGTFKVTSLGTGMTYAGIDGYITEANTAVNNVYLKDATWIDTKPDYGVNSYTQDFVIPSNAPIPEPAFYQMTALLTLGGLGLVRLRKRK